VDHRFLLLDRRNLIRAAGGVGLTLMSQRYAQSVSDRPIRGGTLTMLVDPEPTTLVALTNSADPTMLVSGKVNEGLLSYDFWLNPQPQLATGWSVDDNGLRLTFRLRPGVRWHDGEPITSDDVVHSIEMLKAYHPRGRSTFANVDRVETPDALTAVIVLSRPAPYLMQAFAGCESPMVPYHLYRRGDQVLQTSGEAPVGTGPFVFKEWVRGSHIIYERNPDYWDQPKPYLDRLIVRFIDNPASKMSALESGVIDLAPGTPLPLADIRRLMDRPEFAFETGGYQYTNQVVRLEFNLDDPIFVKSAVRRAVASIVDRKALIDRAWLGFGKPAIGPISPDLASFRDTSLAPPQIDLATAERQLDQAGLLRGTDGIRARLPLDYVPAGDGYLRSAEFISEALKKIGIDAPVRSQDFGAYVKRIYAERDFHFAVSRTNNMFDPAVGVQRVYWSKNFKRGVPFSNGAHYQSMEADALLESAASEGNLEKRRADYDRFQQVVLNDLPDVTLLAPTQITIARRSVANHTLTADGPAANLADAYIRS
jgi:peptide/nickel transport system substrate-binding protein